jgi:hypothetical protein
MPDKNNMAAISSFGKSSQEMEWAREMSRHLQDPMAASETYNDVKASW